MRDDLRPALIPVQWADAQIPILQERFASWQRNYPYELRMERDPNAPEWEFLAAYLRTPLDPVIIGDVGAIIHSARTALDVLMSALLTSNRKRPNSSAHFPIRKDAADFLATVDMYERKQWITPAEGAAIKAMKAYPGGDAMLFHIRELDNLRKHERVLTVEPVPGPAQIMVIDGASYAHYRAFPDKTILYRLPAGRFRPTHGNTLMTAEIFLNEPTVLADRKPALLALRNYIARVRALIEGFP